MRAKSGLGVALLGALVALLGAAIMVLLGPDGRMVSGPHPIDTDGIAIVTEPSVLSWSGLQIDVLAELPANKPVFIGLGNSVDVNDFVRGTQHLEVTNFHTPWTVRTRVVEGRDNLTSAPTALDWWLAQGAGLGGASLSTTLPDQTVSVAILTVGSSNLRGLTVTIGYGLRGGFGVGVGLLLLGLGMVLLGRLLWRGAVLWPLRDGGGAARVIEGEDIEFVEEVVYVFVDEDGVEHEISPDEAARLEAEEEAVETAEEVVGPVVYVYVDPDGVEHEISASELADYDLVEDDEENR